jgi:hypothetical protein
MRLLHAAIALALIASTAAYADIIRLKNGRVINGTYLGGTPREVKVQIGENVETLQVSDIVRIEFAGADQGESEAPVNRPVLRRAASADDNSNSSQPTLRRADTTSSTDTDADRPTLRRSDSASSTSDDSSGQPTLRRASSTPPADDDAPTLRRSDSASQSPGQPVAILRPSDTGPTAASTAATVAAQPQPVEIPAGTNFVIRMIEAVDSSTGSVGQIYRASMDQPIMIGGQMIVPRGADATVKLVEDKESGRLAGKTVLTLQLAAVKVNGKYVDINTQNISKESDSRGKKTATMAAGGAILGAVIGGMAGGGKGAAVGAGGAAGAGVEAVTKGEKVKIPSETLLTFILDNPVTVTI